MTQQSAFLTFLLAYVTCLTNENNEYGFLTKPNEESGRKVDQWNEQSGVNPEELGEYFEGDILLPNMLSKNGLLAETSRWPGGEVPYEISSYFSTRDRDFIKKAMEQYHKHSCIRFRHRKLSDSDWIYITNTNTGCWSNVGKIGGQQRVNLQSPNCLIKIGTVIHELLHALGFEHEQNRWERDSYVTIHWQNIQKGRENNFKKSSKSTVSGFGVPYDYGSVMHYSEKAFSQNGEPTISVKKLKNEKIGQREHFSKGDIQKVLLMYNCSEMTNSTNTVGSEGGANHNILGGIISMLFP